MAELKGSERLVAESLKAFFLKREGTTVDYREGEDPPDIYFNVDEKSIGVEVTDIDENRVNGRRTVDAGYLTFIGNLKMEFKESLPDGKYMNIIFCHYYNKVSAISRKFKKYFIHLLENEIAQGEISFEDTINGVTFKINLFELPEDKEKTIIGGTTSFCASSGYSGSRNIYDVAERIVDTNIDFKSIDIVNDSIEDKNRKCEHLEKPVYLALFDNFFNKFTNFENGEHFKHYDNISQEIVDFGVFDRVFIVFENRDVLEIKRV